MEFHDGSNIFVRTNKLAKIGDVVEGHTHNFNHTTIVFTGAVRVTATLPSGENIERDFVAPSRFLVRADVTHRIVATAPNTEFWCVYAHRDPQGEVVQQYTGWPPAYC